MSLESYFEERIEIGDLLGEANEYSLLNVYHSDLPKVLILSVASRFERDVTDHIETFYSEISELEPVAAFVKKKALNRQYHSLFNWDAANVNAFVGLFGPQCKAHFATQIVQHDWLNDAARDFLALGQARNVLIHLDLATQTASMTAQEVAEKYRSAVRFVEAIPFVLRLRPIPTREQGAPESLEAAR
ncbi:HEPN domain-containing protein [Paenarthrobacter sp. NPDC056912]|uniref:HEPN domain-containing protein n=1 Tax=Paenarthrobacter sp. NPDC056912 TaxID=3345965 RepID=UPI00366D8433